MMEWIWIYRHWMDGEEQQTQRWLFERHTFLDVDDYHESLRGVPPLLAYSVGIGYRIQSDWWIYINWRSFHLAPPNIALGFFIYVANLQQLNISFRWYGTPLQPAVMITWECVMQKCQEASNLQSGSIAKRIWLYKCIWSICFFVLRPLRFMPFC